MYKRQEYAHEVAGEGQAAVVAVLEFHGVQIVGHHVVHAADLVQRPQTALLRKLDELRIGGLMHHDVGNIIGCGAGHQDGRCIGHHVLRDYDTGIFLLERLDRSV